MVNPLFLSGGRSTTAASDVSSSLVEIVKSARPPSVDAWPLISKHIVEVLESNRSLKEDLQVCCVVCRRRHVSVASWLVWTRPLWFRIGVGEIVCDAVAAVACVLQKAQAALVDRQMSSYRGKPLRGQKHAFAPHRATLSHGAGGGGTEGDGDADSGGGGTGVVSVRRKLPVKTTTSV
jgi:hypothetical protein